MLTPPTAYSSQYGGAGFRAGHLRLVLPSDGELYEPTLAFLRACGISVERPRSRSYSAYIPGVPKIDVLFQRTSDITQKVE